MTPESFSVTLADLAPALKNHLWQSTLFLAVAALLTLALRRNHARTRYALWLAASIKFLIPFSLLITLGTHLAPGKPTPPTQTTVYQTIEEVSQPFTPITIPIEPTTPTATTPHPTRLLPIALAAIWLTGFLAVLTTWFLYWRRITTILREATPLQVGREHEILRRLESKSSSPSALGPRPCSIQLLSSPSTLGPGIYGLLRPRLIWPAAISQRLDDAHLESILAHEICHVRRRDNLTAALHMLVEAIFWFHPLVWALGTRLETERERACDESVIESSSALTTHPHIYAESILKICEFYVESPLPCVSGVTGADLKQRIRDILNRHATLKLSPAKIALLTAAALTTLAVPILSGQAKAMQHLSTLIDTAPRKILPSSLASFIAPATADSTVLKDATTDQAESSSPPQPTQPIPEDPQFREVVAQQTTDFLITQLADARQTLDDNNARLTAFLHQNDDKLAVLNSDIEPVAKLALARLANAESIHQLEQNKSVLLALLSQQEQGATTATSANVQEVRSQLNAINLTIASKQKEQQQLEQQKNSYQSHPQPLSSAEEEFRALTRNFEISLHNYNSLLAKLNQVGLAIEPASQIATRAPQTSNPLPQFEVASIKPSGPNTRDVGFYTYPGGRIVAHNFTLKYLVMTAFNIQDFQISGGPDWLNDAHFDIEAKPPATSKSIQSDPPSFKDPPNQEQREMLQSLLIDRFHFTFHRGTAEGQSYVLTRSDKPLKLNPPKDPKAFAWAGSPEGGGASTSGLAGTNITMAQLAMRLSGILKRPVLDQTGLEGAFDFEYKTGSDDSDTDVANAVIHSLQKIGLTLKQTNVPVTSIIIDHAEKPSPN